MDKKHACGGAEEGAVQVNELVNSFPIVASTQMLQDWQGCRREDKEGV